MGAIISIAMLVIYPLNFLLMFPGAFPGDKADAKINKEESKSEVRGAEKIKNETMVQSAMPAAPPVQPVKKNGAENLAIPNAHASIVLDVDSGTILHYDNGKERRQIASLTKMMTAILVMEKINNLNEEVVIDEEAVYVEGTKIGCPRSGYCVTPRLKVGERITALNLLKAMLMNSANDAAIALGKHISGSQEKFAELMNEKAKEMGLNDSNFCTPSGLEIDGREAECYSSAYDIARIAAYATKFDLIWQIFQLPSHTMITSADGKYSHDIINTDVAIDQIPNCLGGKTGFTPLAGYSLMMAASDSTKKHKIISVVLDDPYRWADVKTMVDWTFQAYEWR